MRSSLGLLLAVITASSSPEVVDRILADVDGQAVLLSEARLLGRLRGLDLPAAAEALIDERLMYREAIRLPQAGVSEDEEGRAVEALRRVVGDDVDTDPEWRRIARRQAAILKYIEFRFRPQVRLDEAAIQKACGDPCDPSGRRRLEDAELQQKVDGWVRELRATATIRRPTPPPGGESAHIGTGLAAPE